MHTWVEINLNSINFNLAQLKNIIGPDKMLMPVVKANAYGHGIVEVAKTCDLHKLVDRICVVNDDEALLLITSGIKKPIMILSFYDFSDEHKMYSLAKARVIFPIYHPEQIKLLNKVGERARVKIRVHLKVDCGTSRVGVLPAEALTMAKKISAQEYLQLEGLWSHFASSENDKIYTEKQHKIFQKTATDIERAGIKIPIKHMACSASTVLFSLKQYNAARVGISTYGLHPSPNTKSKISLQPALSWHTRIIQVKTLPKGSKISYSGTYTAKAPITLAVLPVGYYDGYDRSMSNIAHVIIRGKLCPVRGRICMNICMVDVTRVGKVKVDDIATLIGSQQKMRVSAEDLAKWANTINYEIIDRINPLIPRIYTK